jgi:hypothetical protein
MMTTNDKNNIHDSTKLVIITSDDDLICVVCGGHAIANNYYAMTCGSCKIFFHRHAFGSVVSHYLL